MIFDVDGTLVTTKSGATFRKSADDWQWLPGRLEKLRKLRAQGVKLACATNQGGVAFGFMTFADILEANVRMLEDVPLDYTHLFMCVTHPKATIDIYRQASADRKPGPGMLLEAMEVFGVKPGETLMVGDREEDEQAAKNAGVSFQWADEYFA